MSAWTDSGFGLDHVLYVALCLYFLARYVVFWCNCSPWSQRFEWFHYVHLLYFCIVCCAAAELMWFVGGILEVITAEGGNSEEFRTIGLIMTIVLSMTPIALVATLTHGLRQSNRHIAEIRKGVGVLKHDRVLQIICLPPVYGTLALCALVELFHQVAHRLGEDHKGVAYARYETCILVAELYQAWALYQLGRLVFGALHSTLSGTGGAPRPGQRTGRRESSKDVVVMFSAMSSLAWLGIWIFVLISILQAVYSVFLWIGHDPAKDWAKYEAAMQKFSYAGLLAAGAAVYNLTTIGKVFGPVLEDFNPRPKFYVLMAIVTVTFVQLKVLLLISTARQWLLPSVKVKDWEISSTIEAKMLHTALLIFECLACSLVNQGAWDHEERWFEDDQDAGGLEDSSHSARLAGERRPLLGARSGGGAGAGARGAAPARRPLPA